MNLDKLRKVHGIVDMEIEDDTTVIKEVTDSSVTMEVALQPGDEIIDGKLYKSYQFKPGNEAHKNRRGGMQEGTAMKYAISIKDKRMFRHWMSTAGLEKALMALQMLEGKDYLTAYLALAPYAMPKIASVEYKTSDDISTEIGGTQTHTITIRDMRTGTSKVINDE